MISPADASGTFDYIVCANKAINQDEVVSQLQPVVDESRTTIVIIQNGVGNEEPYRKGLPGCSIITCVVRRPLSLNVTLFDLLIDMGWSNPD